MILKKVDGGLMVSAWLSACWGSKTQLGRVSLPRWQDQGVDDEVYEWMILHKDMF